MKKSKVLVLSIMFVFALFGTIGMPGVYAQSVSTNSNTGFGSENDNQTVTKTGFFVQSDNMESVTNSATGENSSGNNSSSFNSGDSSLTSGSVSVDGMFENLINVNDGSWKLPSNINLSSLNEKTGAESFNRAFALFDASDLKVKNNNSASIENCINESAITGQNSVDYNGVDPTVSTGDATIKAAIRNGVNRNSFGSSTAESSDPTLSASNSSTGAKSENKASTALIQAFLMKNNNAADIFNTLSLAALTGNNSASYNSGSGSITSGAATAEGEISNADINTNDLVFGSTSQQSLTATNDKTGAESINNAAVDFLSYFTMKNDNCASIANTLDSTADSGQNVSDYNMGDGSVTSGAASSVALVRNMGINTNSASISSPIGALTLTAGNSMTGALSENKAIINVKDLMDLSNTNSAQIENVVNSNSTTGNNSASYNSGSGAVTSGEATSDVTVVNQANVNKVTVSDSGNSADVIMTNEKTGANSVNVADASIKSSIAIFNLNDASISNQICSSSNTGGNTSDYNTSGGAVTTGGVTASFGAANMLNMNLVQ